MWLIGTFLEYSFIRCWIEQAGSAKLECLLPNLVSIFKNHFLTLKYKFNNQSSSKGSSCSSYTSKVTPNLTFSQLIMCLTLLSSLQLCCADAFSSRDRPRNFLNSCLCCVALLLLQLELGLNFNLDSRFGSSQLGRQDHFVFACRLLIHNVLLFVFQCTQISLPVLISETLDGIKRFKNETSVLTEPKFPVDISESVSVGDPIAIKIHCPVFATLKDLKR